MVRRARTFGKPRKRTAPRKSKLKNGNQFNEDNDPPSEATWAKMASYGSFVVDDSDGEEYTFTKEDCAIIVPTGRDPKKDWDLWEYWVGKITDIRAIVHDENSNTVWARVQWFYSGKDVSGVIKSFNPKTVSKYERVFSDHFDFVAPESFNGHATVADFQEDDPEQAYIRPRNFYRRYTIEPKARKLLPKPGSKTCVCSTPYVPEDANPSKLMHFCPRPSCRMAYHEKCLLSIKSQDPKPAAGPSSSKKSPAKSARKHASSIHVKRRLPAVNGSDTISPSQSRALRLLACSPDTDDEIDLQSLIPITIVHGSDTEIEPPKKKRRGRPKNIPSTPTETVLQQPHTLTEVLSTLPSELLQIAQQPLVRGGAFAVGGVAGNIGAVTRARRIVYQILEGGEVPDDWEEMLFGEDGDSNVGNAIVKLTGGKTVIPPLLCPQCNILRNEMTSIGSNETFDPLRHEVEGCLPQLTFLIPSTNMYHSQLTRIARTSLCPVFLNPSLTRAYTVGNAAQNRKAQNSNGHTKNPEYVARGLKAAIHNPKVSSEAKDHATKQLKEMDNAHKEAQQLSESNHIRRQLAGYKATLSNKKTSEEAKKNAQYILGVDHKDEKHVTGGYKAALKNPHTSDEAKDHLKKLLKERNAL